MSPLLFADALLIPVVDKASYALTERTWSSSRMCRRPDAPGLKRVVRSRFLQNEICEGMIPVCIVECKLGQLFNRDPCHGSNPINFWSTTRLLFYVSSGCHSYVRVASFLSAPVRTETCPVGTPSGRPPPRVVDRAPNRGDFMDTTYWSRRRVLTVLGAATAATSIPLAAPSRALAAVGASSVGGDRKSVV